MWPPCSSCVSSSTVRTPNSEANLGHMPWCLWCDYGNKTFHLFCHGFVGQFIKYSSHSKCVLHFRIQTWLMWGMTLTRWDKAMGRVMGRTLLTLCVFSTSCMMVSWHLKTLPDQQQVTSMQMCHGQVFLLLYLDVNIEQWEKMGKRVFFKQVGT